MSTSSWVCAQIWSKARMLRWRLWLLAATEEGVSVVTRNTELCFWAPFLCRRFSERVEFGKSGREIGMEISGSCRGNLEVSTEHQLFLSLFIHFFLSYKLFSVHSVLGIYFCRICSNIYIMLYKLNLCLVLYFDIWHSMQSPLVCFWESGE